MKYLSITLLVVLTSNCCLAQNDASPYSSLTINENDLYLIQEQIIDSLKEELNHYGLGDVNLNLTATAHYVYIDKGKIDAAKRDMDKNLPFNEFIQKHPNTKTDENLIVVKSPFVNYNNQTSYNFSNLPSNSSFIHNITLSGNAITNIDSYKGKWIYNYIPKSPFSDEFILGFYFTSDFSVDPLKNEFPIVETYVNNVQNKSEAISKRMGLDKILSFLERLIDVCASLIVNHNSANLVQFGIANMMIPKMTKITTNNAP